MTDDAEKPGTKATLRPFASFAESKDDEYRYWQSRPASERLAAVCDLSIEAYRLKGILPTESGLRGPRARPMSKRTLDWSF